MRYFKEHTATDDMASGGGAAPAPAANGAPAPVTAPVVPPAAGGNTPSPTSWPDSWRQALANNDEKELKRLERFAAPTDVYKSFRNLEQRLSSGELKAVTPFPDKGTPEQQTAWRAEHGIPDAPDKYDLKLPEGLAIGENDKPIIDGFLKFLHEKNIPSDAASASVQWYFDFVEKQAEQKAELNASLKQETEEALRGKWGADYRLNKTSISNLLSGRIPADSELHQRIAIATDTNAEFAELMAQLAREINPVATLIPNNSSPNALEDEITAMEKQMADKNSDYWKDERKQARYRELVTARERLK